LLAIGVGLVPGLLAVKIPMGRKRVRLDRKLAIGLQAVGVLVLVLVLVGALIWFLWLVP
jgi:hypothetical protein